MSRPVPIHKEVVFGAHLDTPGLRFSEGEQHEGGGSSRFRARPYGTSQPPTIADIEFRILASRDQHYDTWMPTFRHFAISQFAIPNPS